MFGTKLNQMFKIPAVSYWQCKIVEKIWNNNIIRRRPLVQNHEIFVLVHHEIKHNSQMYHVWGSPKNK